jgi:hypothetical protein
LAAWWGNAPDRCLSKPWHIRGFGDRGGKRRRRRRNKEKKKKNFILIVLVGIESGILGYTSATKPPWLPSSMGSILT